MSVPDRIKENVRAVLLSKTDGSGVLVSSFLKDYKAILGEPLMYRDLGFQELQDFIKAIPEVCRLEFSEKAMAYRLYGISKPNTYVSSFTKKAEGNDNSRDSKDSRSNSDRREKEKEREAVAKSLGTGLDEDWLPNFQGYFTVCFHNRKAPDLNSREAVALQFSKVGEVVDINITKQFTFIRYNDQENAKTAIRIWGEAIGLRRADEKVTDGKNDRRGGRNDRRDKRNDERRDRRDNERRERRDDEQRDRHDDDRRDKRNGERRDRRHDERRDKKSDYEQDKRNDEEETERSIIDRPIEREMCEDRPNRAMHTKPPALVPDTQMKIAESEDKTGHCQVYIGNWPNEATNADLEDILQDFKHLGCRINQAKDNIAKRYVFVDFGTITEAEKMISQMNGKTFLNRDLVVRMGKGKKGSSNHNNNAHEGQHNTGQVQRGSIEDEFERLCVHRGKEKAAPLSPVTQTSPISRTVVNDRNINKTEQSSSSPSKMPLLEKMPVLETSNMPELEPMSPQKMPKFSPKTVDSIPNKNQGYNNNNNNNRNFNGYDDMPVLEPMGMTSPAQSSKSSTNQESEYVQVFISNFPYGTKEWELGMLMEPYGGHSIVMKNKNDINRSTYAFVTFDSVQQADVAIMNLDQTVFKGRRLTVAMGSHNAGNQTLSSEMSLNPGPLARITCTVGGNDERTVSMGDEYHFSDGYNSQISPMSHESKRSTISNNMSGPLYISRRDEGFNYKKFTMIVKDYSLIVTKLRGEDEFDFGHGQKLRVLVTHVENERFFWGQVLVDNVKGVSTNLKALQSLMTDLQTAERSKQVQGMGRCMAMFQGEWYRGWCTHISHKEGEMVGDVLYVDYGNMAMVPLSQLFVTQTHVWVIPPMAKPFKLRGTEPLLQLKSLENEVVSVEVKEPGCNVNNFLTTVNLDL